MNINDIKIGDTVICIDNGIKNDTISKPMLTIGKRYIITKIDKEWTDNNLYIIIKNDLNISYGYYDCRFINLSMDRKMKLEKLNEIRD